MDRINESFELDGNEESTQSELEKVMRVVGVDTVNSDYPVSELRCCDDPINEYNTKQLMQSCFPTLFPDGLGDIIGLMSMSREHTSTLVDYCAHLMKWHDRRFVIHGNFKFFCLNLIQRRQIDGLVRRVRMTESREETMRAAGLDDTDTSAKTTKANKRDQLRAAMHVLDTLKPFFRVVRGSGLYWSNTHEDLMAMLGNRALPTRWPTLFLTLSAADTIWPDFAKAYNPALSLEECML
ncbi:hypothetical protein PHMEG_00021938 [Phytophthora megakarya]|uniref:Helitron helicase-like domain-containing protein n=1 Tax=Phytophthora megakarya TaxID=4795 RepID=A0A225VLK6_9STRA|nr:hypothetical protein PHMEG_00021938 [Phytophthora megakarya]